MFSKPLKLHISNYSWIFWKPWVFLNLTQMKSLSFEISMSNAFCCLLIHSNNEWLIFVTPVNIKTCHPKWCSHIGFSCVFTITRKTNFKIQKKFDNYFYFSVHKLWLSFRSNRIKCWAYYSESLTICFDFPIYYVRSFLFTSEIYRWCFSMFHRESHLNFHWNKAN